MPRQKILVAALTALLAVPIGAIATSAEAGSTNPPEHRVTAPGSEETVLLVNNRNSTDMSVYAVSRTGIRKWIGTVDALSTKEFSISSRLLEGDKDFRIKVYPLGPVGRLNYLRAEGSGIKTHPIPVTAGDRIELLLGNSLDQSTLTVVPR